MSFLERLNPNSAHRAPENDVDAESSLARRVKRAHKWRQKIYRVLAARYRINQSFQQTIRRLADRSAKRKSGSVETQILGRWAIRLEDYGELFHEAVQGWVPDDERMILASTKDDRGADQAAWLVEQKLGIATVTKGALAYPAFLIVLVFVVLYIVAHFVVPQIVLFQQAQGKELSFLFTVVAPYAWMGPLPLIGSAMIIKASLPYWTGTLRNWADLHLWPWTDWRRQQGAMFLLSFSAMCSGPITQQTALSVMKSGTKPWLRERLSAISYWVEDGRPFGESLELAGYGFPDPNLIEDIQDLEVEPREFSKNLQTLAEGEVAEVRQRIQVMARIAGIVAMGMVGATILWVFVTLMSAFDLGGSTRGFH